MTPCPLCGSTDGCACMCESCMRPAHDCHCPDVDDADEPDPESDPALDEIPVEIDPAVAELEELREAVARETIAANRAIK